MNVLLSQKINSIKKRKNEIASMHISVPLAMFCLDTMTLNYDLCERTQNLNDRLIQFQVDVNRDTNARYCPACGERALTVGTNGGCRQNLHLPTMTRLTPKRGWQGIQVRLEGERQ